MKVKLTIGLVILAGALALFFLSQTSESKPVFYYSPTEFTEKPEVHGDRLRLKGVIEEGTVKMSADKTDLRFEISDGQVSIPVHYHGTVPDTFQEGLEAVVDGRMGSEGIFEGHELVVKCPSKYESSPEAASEPAGPEDV